jgi:hypothetical protein
MGSSVICTSQVTGAGARRSALVLAQVDAVRLGGYLEPATSAVIEPDDKGGLGEKIGADVRGVEAKVLAPTQRHEHSMNVWRRMALARAHTPSELSGTAGRPKRHLRGHLSSRILKGTSRTVASGAS